MPSKIKLGIYMYTHLLGGAERHLRDLLWTLDADKFEITLFYSAWPDFEDYLGLEQLPWVKRCPLAIKEWGYHIKAKAQPTTASTAASSFWRQSMPSLKAGAKKYLPGLISMYFTAQRYRHMPSHLRVLKPTLAAQPVDILHINNGGYPGAESGRLAAIIAHKMGTPTLMTIHNLAERHPPIPWSEQMMDHRVCQSVKSFIPVTQAIRQKLLKQRGPCFDKGQIIYCGSNTYPALTVPEVTALRLELGLTDNVPIVGMVANFESRKGHRYLIEGAALLQQKGLNFALLLIGGGPQLTEVKNQARNLGISHLTHFLGFRADAPRLISMFDLLVLPSIELEGGLSYAILEAMGHYKPVVATPVGGLPESVVDGETGLLVPPQNPAALARAIQTILGNPTLARQMGQAGYNRYCQYFTIEKMTHQYEDLYLQLAHQSREMRV